MPEVLKVKYNVTKVEDGSVVTDCFVLRPQKDAAARAALRAYAAATGNKLLAADIRKWLRELEAETAKASDELQELIEIYEANIAPMVPVVYHSIVDWLQSVEAKVIMYAILEAVTNNARTWNYIEAIIRNNFNAGRTTMAAVEAAKRDRKTGADKQQSVYDDSNVNYDEIEQLMREKM